MKERFLAVVMLTLLLPGAWAQTTSPSQTPEPQPPAQEGYESGGFLIRGDLEFGGHIVSSSGNEGTYGTMVDLESGPRLLEQSLEIRALPGTGNFMDELDMFSFGYGGDPNSLTRLRISKDRWYSFSLLFRRDRNFWDYNLLANPFNPTPPPGNTFPQNTLVTDSPHYMGLVRRMADIGLALAPKSPVSVRLGFNYLRMYGDSGTSYHEGADIALLQPWETQANRLSVGVDLKMLPRTRISYDQYLDWFHNQTSALETNLTYQLNDGIFNGIPPVDLGLVLERIGATSSQPCFNPISNDTVTPPAVGPLCQGYLGYRRTNPAHSRYPTERLSLQSSYFKHVDLDASFSYSQGRTVLPNFELANTWVSRTWAALFNVTGPARNRRYTTVGQFGVTVHLTRKLRFHDAFQSWNFRIPGFFDSAETTLFANNLASAVNPIIFDPAVCFVGTVTPELCPTYQGASSTASASGADLALETYSTYNAQSQKMNLAELQYDFNRRLGVRAGYRYRTRRVMRGLALMEDLTYFPGTYNGVVAPITATSAARGDCRAGNGLGPGGADVVPDAVSGICNIITGDADSDDISINEHSLVAGAWARPIDRVRLNFDMELGSEDNAFIRTQPRHKQQYKLRATVKPARWATVSGTMNLLTSKSHWADIDYDMHNYNAGFSLMINRGDWLTLDLGYNYNGFRSNDANLCFYAYDPSTNTVVIPPGTNGIEALPGGAATGSVCDPSRIIRGGVPAMVLGTFTFDETVHTGNFDVLVKPVKRVTAGLGYTLTSSTGTLPDFNPNAPIASNSINYHLPSASLAVDVTDGVQLKGAWEFYDYNEKFAARRTEPRDFRAHVFTLSARYHF